MASSRLFWLVGLLFLFGQVAAAPVQGQFENKDEKVAPQVNLTVFECPTEQQQHRQCA